MKAEKLASYCLAGLLAGCVPLVSLQPLFTRDKLVFAEELLGIWAEDANKPQVTWEFARLEEEAAERLPGVLRDEAQKCYRVRITDSEDRKGVFAGCLVKLGDRLFLDLVPDKFPSGEHDPEHMALIYNAFFFLRVHTFMRIDIAAGRLTIRLTDDEAFKKLVEAVPKAVKHDVIDDHPVLTAAAEELQAFVTKYADDERLFANELALVRKSK